MLYYASICTGDLCLNKGRHIYISVCYNHYINFCSSSAGRTVAKIVLIFKLSARCMSSEQERLLQ